MWLFFPVKYLLRASRSVSKHGILKVYIWKHVYFTLSKWEDNLENGTSIIWLPSFLYL